MNEVKFYWLNRKPRNPKWFKSTTVHTAYLEYELKDIFYYEDRPVLWTNRWPDEVKIYYRKLWELEPILFDGLTWVIRKELIEEFEKELWNKIYKEIEFLPVEIVPKWLVVKWKDPKEGPILKEYYLAHVLNRIEPKNLNIKECKELKQYDFIWMPDWPDIMFSEKVKRIIEEKKMNIWYFQEQDICRWARLKETEEWRKKLEERRKEGERFNKEIKELEEWMKRAQEEIKKMMKKNNSN